MAVVTSKVQICAMANADLGNRNTISNIDTPRNDKELIFSQFYDVSRQYCLKTLMPNFALDRDVLAAAAVPVAYQNTFGYAFPYPTYCLKLLGIGDIDCTGDYKPTIEGGLIFTNNEYLDGMPIRFVRDITDVTQFSVEFVTYMAKDLAQRCALGVTQDQGKKKQARAEAKEEAMNTTALNAQENKPVRRSVSRWRASRLFNVRDNEEKR